MAIFDIKMAAKTNDSIKMEFCMSNCIDICNNIAKLEKILYLDLKPILTIITFMSTTPYCTCITTVKLWECINKHINSIKSLPS